MKKGGTIKISNFKHISKDSMRKPYFLQAKKVKDQDYTRILQTNIGDEKQIVRYKLQKSFK